MIPIFEYVGCTWRCVGYHPTSSTPLPATLTWHSVLRVLADSDAASVLLSARWLESQETAPLHHPPGV